MKLVLLRHATRSAFETESGPAGESPLNTVGRAQAEDLIQHLAPHGALPTPTRLICSPKLRARQTLTPLSRETALELEIDQRLDERTSGESLTDFHHRVKAVFTDYCEAAEPRDDDVLFLCSHLDWLEAAVVLWPSQMSEREASKPWHPLEYQVFRLRDGILNSGLRGEVAPRF